jgi:hypothetical protein
MTFASLAMEVLDITFDEFGVNAVYSSSGGQSINVRVIAKQPDEIIGFGDTRVYTETSMFEVRVSELAQPRPDDLLTINGDDYVIQGEPERRDPQRLVWTLDTRPA